MEFGEDFADHVIHAGDHAVVGGDDFADILFGKAVDSEGALKMAQCGVEVFIGEGCVDGQVDGCRVVEVIIGFWHGEGPVREEMADIERPGLGAFFFSFFPQVVQCPVGDNAIVIVVANEDAVFTARSITHEFGRAGAGVFDPFAFVGAHITIKACGKGFGQRDLGKGAAATQDFVMGETSVLIFSAHVQFAEQSGFNACVVEAARPGHFTGIQGNANMPGVDLVYVFTGDEAHAAGHTDGAVAVGTCKVGSSFGQSIEVRRLHGEVAIAGHAGMVLVGADDEDVGLGHRLPVSVFGGRAGEWVDCKLQIAN